MSTTLLIVLLALYGAALTAVVFRQRAIMRRRAERSEARRAADARSINNTKPLTELGAEQVRFQEKADEALRLTQTFQKFVPRQFVEHFAKHGETSLELGRADEDNVAILFCDIRGFTGLSERMRPQELMKFLNSYFLRMNDPIHQNNGFIDKFIGDAIMALFDHPNGTESAKANDALNAAVDLHRALEVYNAHRANSGYPPIKIGVGVHYGAVIIGTVGSDDRMDTTVIGDSVNIANRLEALAPVYHADIVVSEQLLKTAANTRVKARVLDWVKVKGRRTPLKIYEICNHLPEAQRTARMHTSPLIDAAISARIEQRWDDAIAAIQKAIDILPDDPLLLDHLKVCQQHRDAILPDNWDGALTH
ncbi:adenylate/guanylate cyclase domain-containing protein [Alteromonas oceanisediminis]|uniref:adenylate/guanylate cyclase domain-containing protein n=1 Tax=Alteromonas oceanisediminis TaxID=2836180 RepID=UPI001BDB2340|nr:adenylate/guanylate cyclase domain-containing protein [Alteromonas oceanisediminis]MBT0586121.1 adenylate/guanylate cyclase domain-containing protein [Alteromonas oceanisediminis]